MLRGSYMTKKVNWQQEVAKLIDEGATTPFEWGTNDCCLFASDVAKIQTGIDMASVYRGTYDTKFSALRRVIKNHGSFEAIFDEHFERVPNAMAQRGDIVMTSVDKTMGIVWSGGALVSTGFNGICKMSAEYAPVITWRVA